MFTGVFYTSHFLLLKYVIRASTPVVFCSVQRLECFWKIVLASVFHNYLCDFTQSVITWYHMLHHTYAIISSFVIKSVLKYFKNIKNRKVLFMKATSFYEWTLFNQLFETCKIQPYNWWFTTSMECTGYFHI